MTDAVSPPQLRFYELTTRLRASSMKRIRGAKAEPETRRNLEGLEPPSRSVGVNVAALERRLSSLMPQTLFYNHHYKPILEAGNMPLCLSGNRTRGFMLIGCPARHSHKWFYVPYSASFSFAGW